MPRTPGRRWKSKFARFVCSYGVERLAKKLNVHPSALYHWVRAVVRPRPEHAEIIQRLARERGTRLTLDDIYAHGRDLRAVDPALANIRENMKVRAAAYEAQRARVAATSRQG
jgi:transposase-like protein